MAMAVASSVKLTLATVKKSVDSYPLSVNFMKKLVPISVSTVLSQRLHIEPDNFHHLNYGKTDYFVVKKTPRDPKFKLIFNSFHGILDSIENQYLKELHVVLEDKNSGSVLEKYKYKFFYNEKGLEPEEKKEMKKEIFITVTKHLTDIKELGHLPKLPEDTVVSFFLTYYDNTPKDYEPYFFEEGSKKSYLIKDVLQTATRISFEKVSTGFHSVTCSARVPELILQNEPDILEDEKMEEENIENKEENGNNNQNKNSIEEITNPLGETTISIPSNGGIDESWDSPMDNNKNDFNCICGINESINQIRSVVCSVCYMFFHYPCISVFMNKLPEKFVCWECAESREDVEATNVKLTSLKINQRETIAIRFLFLDCIFERKSFPSDILHKLSEPNRKRIVYFLKEHRFATFHKDEKKTILDFDAIEKYIRTLNDDYDEEDSSKLPETEEIIPPKRVRKI